MLLEKLMTKLRTKLELKHLTKEFYEKRMGTT
jgi:hypothetical protein